MRGVGFFINKKVARSLKIIQSVSTRAIYAIFKINTGYNLKVIQVYEEVHNFSDDLCTVISNGPAHFTVVCGDFNAKIGMKSDRSETVRF